MKEGDYFISKMNNVCQMQDDIMYYDFFHKTRYFYVENSEFFCKLREATDEEIKMKTTNKEQINLINKVNSIPALGLYPSKEEFILSLPIGHDIFEALEEIESLYLEFVFKQSKYNQVKTARWLGISRSNVRAKLKKYFGDTYIGS